MGLQRDIRRLLQHLRPHEAAGVEKIRIGPSNDGGYVMLDDFDGIRVVAGCGVGYNVDFEWQLAEKGIAADLFDHTVEGLPRRHERMRFHRLRVGIASSDGIPTVDLEAIARLHDLPEASAVLKIDIEGDEWRLFEKASPAALRRFRQIVCEFHWFERAGSLEFRSQALAAVKNLTRDFAVVHVHANNHSPMLSFGGMLAPSVLEVTLASRRHYRLQPGTEEFPTPLDAPNHNKRPDYWLGQFDFSQTLTQRLRQG